MRLKNKARSFKHVRKSRSNKGVSPVIGVILMVAATIVIAGVVMAMLGGFGPPKRSYMVTATASENATGYIYVTYQGGPDSTMAQWLNCSIDGVEKTGSSDRFHNATVGASVSGEGTAGSNNNHVTVTAYFKDGTTQVILDTWV